MNELYIHLAPKSQGLDGICSLIRKTIVFWVTIVHSFMEWNGLHDFFQVFPWSFTQPRQTLGDLWRWWPGISVLTPKLRAMNWFGEIWIIGSNGGGPFGCGPLNNQAHIQSYTPFSLWLVFLFPVLFPFVFFETKVVPNELSKSRERHTVQECLRLR